VENNIVTLDSIYASLYGGKLQGEVKGWNFRTQPEWQWKVQLDKIQLKPMLTDVNGANSKIKIAGTGSFTINAETSGITREQLLRQLHGNSVFNLEDGIIEGMDLNYFVQLADATIQKQAVDTLVNTNQTAFNQLNGTAVIKNGVATTSDLQLLAPAFATRGEGSIELLSRHLDFELKIRPQLQNTKIKWSIPILVTGDLDHPDINLDMMEVQKVIAGIEINNLKQKASVQIQKHIKGKTGEILQKLLGQ
jgi:AsmA protein